ncbi:MAG: spore cortex biosynthesis protein YabQ [Oscillospiraceae bacterium]
MCYDALRALRRRCPRGTLFADMLFGLLLAAAFLLFALTYGGGQFRLYLFLAVGLTAILYFLTLSPAVVRLFQALFSLLGRFVQVILTPARFFLKFLKKILKTLFARCRKWFTMTCKHISDWKHAQLERSRRRNEVRQVVSAGQAGDSDPRCVRYCYALVRLRSQINEKDAEVKGLTSSIASTQQENDRLQSSIDALDTPEGLEQVARDQLGMVSEGEIVFEDVGDS